MRWPGRSGLAGARTCVLGSYAIQDPEVPRDRPRHRKGTSRAPCNLRDGEPGSRLQDRPHVCAPRRPHQHPVRYPAWWRVKSAGPSTSPARPRSVPAGTRRIDPAKRSSSPRLAIWKASPVGRRSIAAGPPPPSARANLAKRRSACFHRANACQKAHTRGDECATTVRTKRSALMYSEWIPRHVTKTSRTRGHRHPSRRPLHRQAHLQWPGPRASLSREYHPNPDEPGGKVRPTCVKRLVRGHGQAFGQGRRRSPSRAQANQDAGRGMPTTAQDARRGMPTTTTPPLIPLQMD